MMPTLEDVARKAGVSTATVSKVLSNTPYFTASTRDKVMRAVEETGYMPHLAARALAAGRTCIVGVVFPWVYDGIFTDPHILHILEGIEPECSQHGYNILLITPRLTTSGVDEHYLQLIRSGYIDGIIALDNVPFASVLEPIHKKGIPVVNIGYHVTSYMVRSDDYTGGYQLMQHLVALGHGEIGIIDVQPDLNYSAEERMKGVYAAAEASGMSVESLPTARGDFSVTSGEACAADLLARHPNLTALICLNDRMALGAIQQARRMGRQVPQQLSVVGFDDIPLAAASDPALTTIRSDAPRMGREATRMLFSVLNGQTPDSVLCPVQLIVRQSTTAVKGGCLT